MKNYLQTIGSSALAILFTVLIVGGATHLAEKNSSVLKAAVITDINFDDVDDNAGITFASPAGTAYPINNVVTINSLYIDYILASLDDDGIASGTTIDDSPIFLSEGSVPCPAGTVYTGRQVVLPDTFVGSCTIGVSIPGRTNINEDDGAFGVLDGTNELTISANQCTELQASILLGQGSNLEVFDPADLGVGANSEAFADLYDFATLDITSLDFNYPVAGVAGARTFNIRLDFVSDISIDPIGGVTGRAEVVSNNGLGTYEIKVRDEGDGNEVETAQNFAYVFNDLLGANSPFIAYNEPLGVARMNLRAVELGSHTNDYSCTLNDVLPAACFTGGSDGVIDVLTAPLMLGSELVQGESAIVFASNSSGGVEWTSSNPANLEVTTLTEANEADDSLVDFVDTLLDDAVAVVQVDNSTAGGASYDLDCDVNLDDAEMFVSESCQVNISLPVTYNIAAVSYTANVSLDEVVEVSVQGSELNGFLTGTGTYTNLGGISVNLTGTVSGVVTGTAVGAYTGTVNGQISAPISVAGSLAGLGASAAAVSDFDSAFSAPNGAVSEGTLSDIPGSFSSTVKSNAADNSNMAILFPKRAGTSLLTAVDGQGCIATFNLEVIGQEVILDPVGFNSGDVLDVADVIQINAFVGAANQEIEETQNISAAAGIEWFSSNEEVATVDGTGLLTALRPGITNITARYDTGDAEIGTIESKPLSITVNKITDLLISYDETTQAKLNASDLATANQSITIAIHNPEAAGKTLTVEGQTVNITLPTGTYDNDIAKVTAITAGLQTAIDGLTEPTGGLDIVNVTTVDGFPGMLVLEPNNQAIDHDGDNEVDLDENGQIDISTTANTDQMAIIPNFEAAIDLPAAETYGLDIIAKYDNGATEKLLPTAFTWVNTPVNYLQQAALDTGLLKFGEIAGLSNVVAQFENADGSFVQSNYLTVEVTAGPAIDYVHRIGSGNLVKGSRLNLRAKITDVDTVSDITNIETSVVFSTGSTYSEILADAGAIWYSATTFLEEVALESSSETEEGEVAAPTALPYKIYDIPVEIPIDENLFDGLYQLILSITDAENNTLNYVYPIRIGDIGEGDVNGDGTTNMIDVIIAFQIATGGIPSPTAAQLQAANVDGVGGVTLIDVILLFNAVNS